MLKQLSKVRIVFLFATIISVFGVSSCYTKFEQISLGSTKFSSVSDNGTVIHIESQGSGMNTKTTLKTHTMATLIYMVYQVLRFVNILLPQVISRVKQLKKLRN